KAEASASGQLFGKTFQLVDLWVKAAGNTSGSVTGSYELDVLSAKLLGNSINVSAVANNTSLEKGYEIYSIEEEIDVGVPITLKLSADLTASLGVQGTASYSTSASSLTFTGTPGIDIGLAASVGVGFSFASVGVEGTVSLINVSLPVANTLTYSKSAQ